jgi:hypothetical protein
MLCLTIKKLELDSMIAQRFPEALNQGHATFAQVLRGETIILTASLFMGFLGYTFTIVLLGLTTAFVKRIPFRVMHKASMLVGIGAAALTELYRIPFLLHRASEQTAIIGICLGVGVLVMMIGAAVRLVWRSAFSHQSLHT